MSSKNKKQPNKKTKKPNNEIMKITYIFLLIFICMIGYFIKFEVKDSDELINNSYNKRENILKESVIRGNILSDDRQILATTLVDENGNETRSYPFGSLFAHSVGYITSTHGEAGVESIATYKLLTSNAPIFEKAINDIKGNKNIGNNVITTLNVGLTQVANEALGDSNGAVIVIEPSTGKILTLISKPDFDPNTLDSIWDELVSDSNNSNLVNRATSGLYTPGSTFKLFTLFEYIRENSNTYQDYQYDCHSQITVDDNTIRCANSSWHGNQDLTESFANSCNSSFVNLGLTLDKSKLRNLCNSLLFNTELPIAYPSKKSSFVLDSNSDTFETMQTVMGQGKTTVTPIHLAMIASSIANDGVLMKPYVVSKVENYLGTQVKKYSSTEYSTLFSKSDCELLRPFLRAVITSGTGKQLNSDTYTAYGKTGTAQINDGSQNNSLFMGYAESGSKKLALCIVKEDVPEGSTSAVPIAKRIFDTYFSSN